MKTLYLCGPINGCTDEECRNWRELVKSNWAGRCIDPMVRDYRGRETEAFREIVELDKIDVTEADIILVNYDKPSVGTSMEVLYAWERYHVIAARCGYDGDLLRYAREHEVLHHLVAEMLRDEPSRVLWPLAHGRDPALAEAAEEEALVMMAQRWVRAAERPMVPHVDWDQLRERAIEVLG